MAVSGSLQLLNKRLVLINTGQVIGGNNDRGEFNVPIPQQLQDPTANDLVYKMYIQSLTLQNEQPGVNASNNKFRLELFTQDIPGRPGLVAVDDIPSVDVELPIGDFTASEIIDFINFAFARQRKVVNANNWILPKFATAGTDPAKIFVHDPNNEASPTTLPFGSNGNYMCFVPQARKANNEWTSPVPVGGAGPAINTLLDYIRCKITFADPSGKPNRSNILLGFPGSSSYTLMPLGSGLADVYGNVEYGYPMPTGFVTDSAPTSLTALNARVWRSPAPMLIDDFSELYLHTDLPTNNYDVKKQSGLNESHVTAVIPITGGLGTRVQYLDDKGINGAFQRNQSTITRLSVKLTNKYGEKVIPSSDWTMVLAIEAYQDHWKTMQDIQMASQDFHGEQLKLAKLQLLHSYFHTQTGQVVLS